MVIAFLRLRSICIFSLVRILYLALVPNEHPRLGADHNVAALAQLVDASDLLQRPAGHLPEPRPAQSTHMHARAISCICRTANKTFSDTRRAWIILPGAYICSNEAKGYVRHMGSADVRILSDTCLLFI